MIKYGVDPEELEENEEKGEVITKSCELVVSVKVNDNEVSDKDVEE